MKTKQKWSKNGNVHIGRRDLFVLAVLASSNAIIPSNIVCEIAVITGKFNVSID